MEKIYIIDAVNFLFRSYYAIGPMTNDKGQSTSAVYGFIRSVQKIIKEHSPGHLICAFDGPDNKKSRQTIYAEYKMHRKGAPEDLFPQFDWAYEFCKLAGISVLCHEGVEADDTMASVAVWAEQKGAQVFLCSSDKDHMLDFLAIMGDASDNIPGIEGFGPKTAAALLQEFGTLDEILKHPEKVKGEKKQEALRTQREAALMSRELATLDTAVDIPKQEEFYRLKEINREKLAEFYHSMNFNTLLRELGSPEPAPKKGKRPVDQPQYILVDNETALQELLMTLSQQKEVGLDTETTGEHPLLTKLVGIGFCYEPGKAWYVPCNGELGEKKVLDALRHFFAQTTASFYGHNIKYDVHVLQNIGIEIKHIGFDTLLASYLLNPQNRRHNLDELTLETFQKIKIPIEDLIGKGKSQRTMLEVPIVQVKDYCCEDVDYTSRLKELFQEELEEKKLTSLFYELELPLLPILAKMERAGIYLDVPEIQALGQTLTRQLNQLKQAIFQAVGEEFNLNSPKQLSQILYEKLALQPSRKKGAEGSTSADVLEELVDQHPIVQRILDYRGLEKLRSTYAEALPEVVNPQRSEEHTSEL